MADLDYTFEDFEEGVEQHYNNLLALGTQFDRVVGIARGGLFLATRLSYKLGIPMTPVAWSHRDTAERESNCWIPEDINDGQNILLVDDIIDSGETISSLLEDWDSSIFEDLKRENITIACCYLNTAQDIMPDLWHKTIDRNTDDSWIKFWWEK